MKEEALAILKELHEAVKAGMQVLPGAAKEMVVEYQRYLIWTVVSEIGLGVLSLIVAVGSALAARYFLEKDSHAADDYIIHWVACSLLCAAAFIAGVVCVTVGIGTLPAAISPIGSLISKALSK